MKDGERPGTQRRPARQRFVDVPVLMTVVTCPRCGAGVEVWTNSERTSCGQCGQPLFKLQRRPH